MGHSKIVVRDFNKDYNIYSAGAIIIQSPEQRKGSANGKKNDIWLFGLVLIHMFYGTNFHSDFMDRCLRTNYPDPSSSQSQNLNDFLSAIFVPESRRDDAGSLLNKLERSYCVIS